MYPVVIQSIASDVTKMIECDDVHAAAYSFQWLPGVYLVRAAWQMATGYTLARDCEKSDYSSVLRGQVRG